KKKKKPLMDSEEVINVAENVISKGSTFAKSINSKFLWMWSWYNTMYLGGAHGVSGILYSILCIPALTKKYNRELLSMIETCKSQCQMKSGNYMTKLSKNKKQEEDALVHWCHGAPAFVSLYAKAFQVLSHSNEKFAASTTTYAEECNKVVWERGILRKGPGLCHGVGGNGYAFLCMYRSFHHNLKYLYQSFCFASFLLNTDQLQDFYATPDNPLSLFEGKIGGGIFVFDTIFAPLTSRFPCFE
ncbi:hypothetical protein RFI_08126, partial [Reticulomyxa filosa]